MIRHNDSKSAECEKRGMTAPLMDCLVGNKHEWEMSVDEATKKLVLTLFEAI